MRVRTWYEKAQVYYSLITLLVTSTRYRELLLKEFDPLSVNAKPKSKKASKQTKNKTEKELCIDKCTHPKPRHEALLGSDMMTLPAHEGL